MKQVLAIGGFFCLCLGLTAQAQVDSLTAELDRHFQASDLPGFAVALVDEDGVLYQRGFGLADRRQKTPFTPETILNLGSVSKTVVGLALVKAMEGGALAMDTPINDILPFDVGNPYFKDQALLVRHLANHTSGILDTKHYGKTYILDEAFPPVEGAHPGFLEFLRSHEPLELSEFLFRILSPDGSWYRKKNFSKTEPGTTQEYANLNAALTAYLIERATDHPFRAFTEKEIFAPLAMTSTSWRADPNLGNALATLYFPSGALVPRYSLITYPDGGLHSNVQDLARLLQAILQAYAGTSSYLTPTYAQLLLPGDGDSERAFWGMGAESRNIGHGGSDPGIQADLQFNADSRIGRILLTNVNAEDHAALWQQYRGVHQILAKYEKQLSTP